MNGQRVEILDFYQRIAGCYDEMINANEKTAIVRTCIQNELLINFPIPSKLLELNAGTGTDAIFMAKQGHEVTATDFSSNMLDIAMLKATHEKLSNITFKEQSLDDLAILQSEAFDGVYSIFDGINSLSNLDLFAKNISRAVRPDGRIILHFLNRFSIWDIVYYGLRGKFKRSVGKLRKTGYRLNSMHLYFFSPREIELVFSSHGCYVRKTYGFSFLLPPDFVSMKSNTYLAKIELWLQKTYPFRNWGEHVLMTLQKKSYEQDSPL